MNSKPAQQQERQPGLEHEMTPAPKSFMEGYKAAGKLKGKKALISGGDSGIGPAVSIAYAKEGADVAFIYLDEDQDAAVTAEHIRRGQSGHRSFQPLLMLNTYKLLGSRPRWGG